jgi:hypothetical protein
VADLVRTDHAERLRREAAERMVAEAKAEADRIRVDTQFETEKARADARRTLRTLRWRPTDPFGAGVRRRCPQRASGHTETCSKRPAV